MSEKPPSDDATSTEQIATTATADRTAEMTVKKETVSSADSDTTSGSTRHWLTNDLIAALLLTSFVFVVAGEAVGLIDLDVLPPAIRLLYIGVIGGAAIWSFGQGVLDLLGP